MSLGFNQQRGSSSSSPGSPLWCNRLDNANDLKPLGLWPSIVKHLTNSEPEMAVQALWVCGTAIQNVGSCREALLLQQ